MAPPDLDWSAASSTTASTAGPDLGGALLRLDPETAFLIPGGLAAVTTSPRTCPKAGWC